MHHEGFSAEHKLKVCYGPLFTAPLHSIPIKNCIAIFLYREKLLCDWALTLWPLSHNHDRQKEKYNMHHKPKKNKKTFFVVVVFSPQNPAKAFTVVLSCMEKLDWNRLCSPCLKTGPAFHEKYCINEEKASLTPFFFNCSRQKNGNLVHISQDKIHHGFSCCCFFEIINK